MYLVSPLYLVHEVTVLEYWNIRSSKTSPYSMYVRYMQVQAKRAGKGIKQAGSWPLTDTR